MSIDSLITASAEIIVKVQIAILLFGAGVLTGGLLCTRDDQGQSDTRWRCTRCGRKTPINFCVDGPCPMEPIP